MTRGSGDDARDLTHRDEGGLARGLRARARANEVERRLSAAKLRLTLFKWFYLPVLIVALVVMIVALPLGSGESTLILGGVVALAGAVAGLVAALRNLVDEIDELEEERTALERSART